ncbi:hypothetical protein MPK64_gp330 [Erwinia phage pEa_SNUABM_16]|uniref:Uncharacterized protein n=1 Tax=Erwinia phage pEa_SNUABM_16 TaxID=2869544 RepID=A0AAE9BUE9_9CAUD|nr:hypothetical protein MPK64_gp330 [Erwinia phage pEa_SNUABM_16]QZE59230.1 hypothetical protein pEaSNUABM18_00327 [Erwinia phage pEa_SNUABM_18]UAW96474.1 hypothetical protein pEaSNUABM16_00330 [Erwinia phage pEa_SNUABM_16]
MSSNTNNLGAAATFGSETQKQLNDQQRRAHSAESGHVNKCTIVVLTSLNANNRFSYMSADEQLREHDIVGKVMDRLPGLIERASGVSSDPNSAYHILHPNNGVPTRIDERIKVGEADSVIVSYTVNKAVSEMYGSLSLALFSAGEGDIADLAAEYGIHSISIVEEAKAPDYIKALAEQVEALKIVNLTSIDEADGALEKPVINYSALPGNPINVLSGAVRTFIMQSISGEVFAAIPNNGELNVKQPTNATPVNLDEDFDAEDEVVDQQGEGEEGEEPTGTDLFGYKAEALDIGQMTEALEALSYDVSAMDEAGIRESFETEQQIWLEKNDNAESDEDEDDGEEVEDDEDEAGDDEPLNPALYLAHLLSADMLDRRALKTLVLSQDLKVYKSDTEETLTTKLLESVEDATEEELVEMLTVFVGLLDEKEIDCPNMRAALASDEDSEEEDSEEEEDEEEEDSEDESEEEDEDESAVADEDEVQHQIDAVEDPLDYFQFPGGSLTAEQRIAAVEAMGENTEGMSIVQVMKAFQRIQTQTNEIDVESEGESNVAELEALLGQYDEATVQHVAESLGILVDECETVDDMIEAIANGGSEDDFAAVEEIATNYGIDLSEIADGDDLDFVDALLAVLPAFLSDDEQEEEDDAEEDEAEEVEEVADVDTDVVENDSLRFVKDVNTENSAGPMLSVEMDQSLVINFTLTDGDTYSEIESELSDINGVNYRYPFNMGKAGKAPGAMLLPAQSLIEITERTRTTRFLADPKTFDVALWAQSLEATLAAEIAAVLYEGRIEDGQDPSEAGIVVGDFLDEEELEAATELGHIDPEQFDEMQGDHLPISSLYSARSRVRPVRVDTAYVALHTTVLNVAVPGFWGDAPVQRMVQAAVNRVITMAQDVEGIKVYAGFTMESAALLNNDRLFEALSTLREIENVQSYSAADAANFDDAEDVIEVAGALDSRDLPLSILSSGLAAATFDNGGDLTVLVPCSVVEEEDEVDEDEDDGEDE